MTRRMFGGFGNEADFAGLFSGIENDGNGLEFRNPVR